MPMEDLRRTTEGGSVMRYVLLVCDDENVELSQEQVDQRFAEYTAVQEEMEARGMLRGRERLRPTSSSTSVRVRDGDLVIADGPFAETKEQIAGFYVIDCDDLDEAVEIAANIPAARWGTIEVRPVWQM
jgi:hypothetical protein